MFSFVGNFLKIPLGNHGVWCGTLSMFHIFMQPFQMRFLYVIQKTLQKILFKTGPIFSSENSVGIAGFYKARHKD
jgi:hypothetical protein